MPDFQHIGRERGHEVDPVEPEPLLPVKVRQGRIHAD